MPFGLSDKFGNISSRYSYHILIRRGVEIIAGKCFYEAKIVSVTIPASVTVISDFSFFYCLYLKEIRFAKDSRLNKIGNNAFDECTHLKKKIVFPKSLKVIDDDAFNQCERLEKLIFPNDSQLEEIIEAPFCYTVIKHLSLPPSIRKFEGFSSDMNELRSVYVNNDLFKSNEQGIAIYSKDGSELVCIIKALRRFIIPEGVRVIKSSAFSNSRIYNRLFIPASVETIEKMAFNNCFDLKNIIFAPGSRLKSLAYNSFCCLDNLIINNENFVRREDDVVISLNPPGIVFVPKHLTEFDVGSDVEVIYSNAFCESSIESLILPKSLKKIEFGAFNHSKLPSVTFEDGAELDYISSGAFLELNIDYFKFPIVKEAFFHNYE